MHCSISSLRRFFLKPGVWVLRALRGDALRGHDTHCIIRSDCRKRDSPKPPSRATTPQWTSITSSPACNRSYGVSVALHIFAAGGRKLQRFYAALFEPGLDADGFPESAFLLAAFTPTANATSNSTGIFHALLILAMASTVKLRFMASTSEA